MKKSSPILLVFVLFFSACSSGQEAPLNLIFASEGVPPIELVNECGSINKDAQLLDQTFSGEHADHFINGVHWPWSAGAGMIPILSMRLEDSFEESTSLEVKWSFVETPFAEPLDIQLIKSSPVEARRCSDGNLYITDQLNDPLLGWFIVEIYSEGQLLNSTRFSLLQ